MPSPENAPLIQPSASFVFGAVPAVAGSPAPPPPTLGPLAPMVGSWTGTGLNTIFRPQSGQKPSTTFLPPLNPVPPPPPPQFPNDNVLELNVTSESTTFTAIPGGIPNRGMVQGDITLAGMTYLQQISDVLTSPPTGIHIEPGIWVVIPSTTDPSEPASVARMASIPHGTTVNAQGTTTVIKGPPPIPSVNITPNVIGGGPVIFPSQNPTLTNTSRIPQTLPSLITQAMPKQNPMTDPTQVLRAAIAGLNITSTTQVMISTNVVAPIVAGGGVDNIAFLVNKGPDVTGGKTGPNAQTFQMMATFWIETVEQEFTLPKFTAGSPPIQVPLQPGLPPQLAPSLTVDPGQTLAAPTKVKLTFTMIQYSQTVTLNFNGLSWPHVSVATLVPAGTLTVAPSGYGVSPPSNPPGLPNPPTPPKGGVTP